MNPRARAEPVSRTRFGSSACMRWPSRCAPFRTAVINTPSIMRTCSPREAVVFGGGACCAPSVTPAAVIAAARNAVFTVDPFLPLLREPPHHLPVLHLLADVLGLEPIEVRGDDREIRRAL